MFFLLSDKFSLKDNTDDVIHITNTDFPIAIHVTIDRMAIGYDVIDYAVNIGNADLMIAINISKDIHRKCKHVFVKICHATAYPVSYIFHLCIKVEFLVSQIAVAFPSSFLSSYSTTHHEVVNHFLETTHKASV